MQTGCSGDLLLQACYAVSLQSFSLQTPCMNLKCHLKNMRGVFSGLLKLCSAWLEGNPGRVAASWPVGNPAYQVGLKQEESRRHSPVQCIVRAVHL